MHKVKCTLIAILVLISLTSCFCQVSKNKYLGCWTGIEIDKGIIYKAIIKDTNIEINSINCEVNTRLYRKKGKWVFKAGLGEEIYLKVKNNKLIFDYLDGIIRESVYIFTVIDFYKCE